MVRLDTLRRITVEIGGRKIDPILESYLPTYLNEINDLLDKTHEDLLTIPFDLEPAGVFSLVDKKQSQ